MAVNLSSGLKEKCTPLEGNTEHPANSTKFPAPSVDKKGMDRHFSGRNHSHAEMSGMRLAGRSKLAL